MSQHNIVNNTNKKNTNKKNTKKTGVLLINLGTPDNYDTASVKKFLREFLSDTRVININPLLWKIILNLFVLPLRAKKVAKKYHSIWLQDVNSSPLQYYTSLQVEKARKIISIKNTKLVFDYAMRYGGNTIQDKINKLVDLGCDNILAIPMYPQYSKTTTQSACDKINQALQTYKNPPQITTIKTYHDNDVYIKSLVASTKQHLSKLDFKADAILSSYHGIPQEYCDKGDDYEKHCKITNSLFNQELLTQNIEVKNYLSFQSRFGAQEWLRPYTEDVIKELIANKVKNLVVIAPGFSCDCLETLEEINIEYQALFLKLGGKNFSYVPCLNASNDSIAIISSIINKHLLDK